jgi:Histidine kinase-, DNA gyrase B-, and HSP90-like ATPase
MSELRSSTDNKTLPLQVANTGFMLDRLGMDCAPLQFLRELTQNAIEAILRKSEKSGEVIWDVDWTTYDLEGLFKLCVVDNGDGMSGDDLVQYINHLSSSGSVQSHYANFGVGAKIAAATRNHAGLIYLSWKDKVGSIVHLWRDPNSGQYGLQLQQRPDDYGYWAHIEDSVKPETIRNSGTKVVLYGNSIEQNTMNAPEGSPSPSRWITRYLNTRYFQFPDGVSVRAREGWEYDRKDTDRNLLRTITGQKKYLDQHCEHSGALSLTDATARWWILRKEGALTQNSGFIASTGHCGALYKNELYEMTTGRTSTAALQNFGVIFGYQQVVIYLEPATSSESDIATDTARTRLLIKSQPLPWADWASEFRERMPHELAAHMEAAAAASDSSDHKEAIKERLKQIEELFHFSRYKPAARGSLVIDTENLTSGGKPRDRQSPDGRGGASTGTGSGGKAGSVYSLFLAPNGIPGKEVKADIFPDVRWITIADGTRETGDLEDRAARFIRSSNTLLINADFRVFADMTKRWTEHYASIAGASAKLVSEVVREWFEQSLLEAVISSNGLRGSKEWTDEQIDKLLSDEGLTAVVLPRWHIEQSIKRGLGTRLGSLKSKAS